MADREHTPRLDCKCLTWCFDYGFGRTGERHHRSCPKWYEYLGTAYRTRTELIVTGHPGNDEGHNCDAMGCSSVSHVLIRLPLASDPAAHVSGVKTLPGEQHG